MSERRQLHWGRILPLVLVAASFLAYANSFAAGFLFDDHFVIPRNARIGHLSLLPVTTRFIVDFTFRLNYAISGWRPADFRLVNILLHAGNAWLLYGVIRQLLRRVRYAAEDPAAATRVAGVAACLWVLHPVQVQAVTYVAQRYELMMATCFLGGLYAFLRGIDGSSRRAWSNVALALCLLGMGCKEVMVVAPLLWILADWCFDCRPARELWRVRRLTYTALVLTWGAFAMVWMASYYQAVLIQDVLPPRFARSTYLLTQAGVLVHYAAVILAPAGLCFDYNWKAAAGVWDVGPQLLVVGTAVAVTAYGILCRRAWAYGLAWWFIILMPTSSIFPLADAAVDHRVYLPLAAPAVGIGILWDRALSAVSGVGKARPWVQVACWLSVLAVAGWLGGQTRERNRLFSDEVLLWQDVVDRCPDNPRAEVALGKAFMDRGRIEEAGACFVRVLAGVRTDAGEGDRYYATVLALAHHYLGRISLEQGNRMEAAGHFMQAVRLAPGLSSARKGLKECRKEQTRP